MRTIKYSVMMALLFGATARAQTVVSDSTDIVLNVDPSAKNKFGHRVAIFKIFSERGAQWEISSPEGWFLTLVSEGCDDRQAPSRRNREKLKFVSGGGAYCVLVSSTGVPVRVTVKRMPEVATVGFLKPGGDLPPWQLPNWTPTTASTTPSPNASGRKAGAILRDCDDGCPEMVVIPAGTSLIGSPADEEGRSANEGPRHSVTFAAPFAVGRYEVTFAEYDACVAAGGCSHKPADKSWGRGRRPAVDVSWHDAQQYVAWLSTKTQQRYHLLSESEWEYAARAGTTTPWNTGSAIVTDDANFLDTFKQTVPVGGFPANAFGLYDMHGNVFEWVSDCIEVGYFGAPADGRAVNRPGCDRVLRGGSHLDQPVRIRSAYRVSQPTYGRFGNAGFRVARSL